MKLGTWGAQRAVMSGDGRCLAAFLRDQSGGSTELNIRPDGNGESWVPVPGVKHTDGIFMSPDGNRIALTNSNDHPFVIEIRDARGGGKLQTITTPEKAPHILCLSPDGSRLAVAECSRDFRGLRVFDAVGGSPLYTVATTGCFANCSFCFSPDGARLAAVTDEDGLFILDAANGRRLLGVARPRIYSRECSICYDTAGRRIAVGDSAISVLDAGSGREITRLTGRNKGETCVSFSPDGRRLAAAGDAEGIRVWDLTTGQEILTFELGGKPDQICFNADGTRLSALVGGSLLQWEAPRERKPR
ncbi:MAG: WD40 repeat domain-containing protein [Kiritimatiellia bacterium]